MDESRLVGEPAEPKDPRDADATAPPREPAAEATVPEPAPSPGEPATGPGEPPADSPSGPAQAERQNAVATVEPVAAETAQSPPPAHADLSSTGIGEDACQAPDGKGENHALAHPPREPMDGLTGLVAPAEREIAGPEPREEGVSGAAQAPPEAAEPEARGPEVSALGPPEEPLPAEAEPPQQPAAPEAGQAAPLAEVVVPETDATEGSYDAPRVAVDEHGAPSAVPGPTETEAGLAAPAAPETEAAEPEQFHAAVSGEAQETPPETLLVEAEALQAPRPPAPAEMEAVAARAVPSAEAIEAVPPPAYPPLEPQRPVPPWSPPSLPSREAMADLLPYFRLALRGVAAIVIGLAAIVVMLVVLYRWVDPPASALMLGQRLAGIPIERRWVPIERISPHLIKAVLLSEDGAFCRHRGVDLAALEEAIESDRGGSTITMQVVKNLFLWPSRSYVRKAIEIGLAYFVELIWPKRRILEIYLNIAEWGDGLFGAEAAARQHFLKPASRLTAQEAALLAVALPNPLERMAGNPSPATRRLAARLLARMKLSRVSLACVRAPRRQLTGLVPGPRSTL